MSYTDPSQHEKRIGPQLQKIAKKIQKIFVKETAGEVDFILIVNSSAARRIQASGQGVPVGMYVANMERTSSALVMAEMLAKWQMMGKIPLLSELEDAQGNKLTDILETVTPENNDMEDSEDTSGKIH